MAFGKRFIEIVELDLDRCNLTYGVAPCTASSNAGGQCYNTFGTCQDRTNYSKGRHTYKFCSRGAPFPPGEAMRPYVDDVKSAPTEIKPEDGLAVRSTTTVKMVDEPDSDVEQDPYVRSRTEPAGGTFWTRLLARNYNYGGRFARVKRAYLTDTWDPAEFTTELYIIDKIKGPSSKGEVTLTLKDPIKIADRVKVPDPTSGKLSVALTTNDLQLTLETGQGTQYPSSGYVRVKDEVIQYTGNAGDVLSWPDGTYRAKFNTSATTAKIGDGVQLCKAWISQPLSTVLNDILNDSGLDNSYIDTGGFETENTNWLGSRYYVTTCITAPEDASTLLKELCQQSNAVMWWDPKNQHVKYKVIGPRSPAETVLNTLTDEANLIEDTVSVESLDDLRLTFAVINYDLATATSDRKEIKNYLRADIYIDTDAESDNEYNDRRQKIENSRWFGVANASAMKTLASRRIAYYRDAPMQIEFSLDPNDADIREGDLYDLTTKNIVDESGNEDTKRVLIVKRQDDGKGRIKVTARTTTFDRRQAFIAPAGHPDYLNSTETQRAYAYICNSSGKMSNGDDGYLII
jgi:hypothetical protein